MDLWIFGLGRKYCNIGEEESISYICDIVNRDRRIFGYVRKNCNAVLDESPLYIWHCEYVKYVTLWKWRGEYLGWCKNIATSDTGVGECPGIWYKTIKEWLSRYIASYISTRLLETYILHLIKSLSAELHLDLVEPVNLADIVLAINWLQKAPRHLLWKSDVIQLLAKI